MEWARSTPATANRRHNRWPCSLHSIQRYRSGTVLVEQREGRGQLSNLARQKRNSILKKGLGAATFAGVMSSCFGYDLARGAPLQALTLMSSGDRTQLTYQEQGQDSHTFLSAQ